MTEPQESFFNFRQDMRRTIVIGGCVSLICIGVMIVAYIKTGAVIEDIRVARRQLGENQQAFNQLALLQSQRQKAQTFMDRLNTIFPDQETVLRVTSQIAQMAQKNKMQQSFSFGAEYGGDAQIPKHIGFNLIAQGGLSDFIRYVQTIEQSPFFLDFGAMEINKTDAAYQMNTTGRIYTK